MFAWCSSRISPCSSSANCTTGGQRTCCDATSPRFEQSSVPLCNPQVPPQARCFEQTPPWRPSPDAAVRWPAEPSACVSAICGVEWHTAAWVGWLYCPRTRALLRRRGTASNAGDALHSHAAPPHLHVPAASRAAHLARPSACWPGPAWQATSRPMQVPVVCCQSRWVPDRQPLWLISAAAPTAGIWCSPHALSIACLTLPWLLSLRRLTMLGG